ncbi:MAG: subunit of tubulin prefoldin [Bathelium mastoideum]|nr:MAG: subunit of tubulin prefoldin [Bathelium mastoideum]KAI9691829.1 MAG: subunit of tubulin prefoldin [Bathelium mastoideum]
MAAATNSQGQPVDLNTLSTPQLSQVKKQLDDELAHLTTSYQNLRAAQSKFRDCLRSIQRTFPKEQPGLVVTNDTSPKSQNLLVPLTPSLYVPATLSSVRTVLVDVGTGFFVEKIPEDAIKFYDEKVEELEKNLKELEKVVQTRGRSVAVVEDVIRQKVLSGQGSGEGTAQAITA